MFDRLATEHLKKKLVKLRSEMQRLAAMEKLMLASPDQQISLTDPDSRSMATSGRGSGVVGHNVQVAVDTEHQLIIAHEATSNGSDRAQLSNIASQAKEVLGVDELQAVADRGYYSGAEILACHEAAIAVTRPKPVTSGIEAKGRFGKQDFRYVADEDVYVCPAGARLTYWFTTQDKGLVLRRYRTSACRRCPIKRECTSSKERLISRWEHEHVLEDVQKRLDKNPQAMRLRRESGTPLRDSEDEDGSDALPDEAPSQRCHRDGAARARLQSHPCDKHHGHSACWLPCEHRPKAKATCASQLRPLLTAFGKAF